MDRRQFLGLSLGTGLISGCLGKPTGQPSPTERASPTASNTPAEATPSSEDPEACEREHQYLPDIRVENDDDVDHDVTLTVRKITRENETLLYKNEFDVPKQGERTKEVAFDEPRTTDPEAEYLATAKISPANSSTGTQNRAEAKVGTTVVVHLLRYGIRVRVNSNGQIHLSEEHVDGVEKRWANTCG